MKLTKIPRNLFQTWSTKNITHTFKILTDSWRSYNPNYAYFLFDDNDCEQFIQTHFEENVYQAFLRILPGAFKADFWRYCVLYIYGGVYVDMDTICMSSIDDLLDEHIDFMTPIDLNNHPSYGKYNLFNCFIASAPKHPILWECIQIIVHNVENNIVPFSNLDFSGPGVLGKATNRYLGNSETTSFLGKEGLIRNIKFLKFEAGNEYVVDPFNQQKLFQNKNGNHIIQSIYRNEINRVNHIDWGSCSNPIKSQTNATIVTMFYNIREKEKNQFNSSLNHAAQKYLSHAKDFILSIDYPLILFTDDPDVIEFATKEKPNHLKIYNVPFEETYFYKDLDRLHDLQQKYTIYNGHLEHETPMYIILNNDKFDFIERAIEYNPFQSTHFIWMDFGINHVAQNTERIHTWISDIPDKIKQLCINPYVERMEHKQMFQNIYHHVAGGLFSGSKANMLTYCQLFKQKTEQIYSEDWYQVDEAVMTIVIRENPDLFSLYYGDYQGIISNYLSPIHNINLIFTGIAKCLDYNHTKQAWDILQFCTSYFLTHLHDPHIYSYIRFKIITDYYNNNQCFTKELIHIVDQLKTDNTLLHIIQNNMTNIHYYKNKSELLLLL